MALLELPSEFGKFIPFGIQNRWGIRDGERDNNNLVTKQGNKLHGGSGLP